MRIRELRMQKGMTQEELAQKVNVSTSSIGMYETGRREPSRETIIAMADLFGCTVDYLLERTPVQLDPEVIARQIRMKKLNDLFTLMTPEQQQLLISLAENMKPAK